MKAVGGWGKAVALGNLLKLEVLGPGLRGHSPALH